MHVGVKLEPAILLRFVSVQVVEDHVDFALRVLGHDLVHEIEKFATAAARIVPCFDLASSDVQRCEKSRCSVPFVAMAEAVQGLAVRQPKIALRPLQRLNVRLLINTDHDRFLGRT